MPFAGVAGDCASSVLLCLLVLWAPALCHAAGNHNITAILAASLDFAQFSAALNSTGLAAEIDNRTTITVLAVDNAVMAPLLARRLPQGNLHHVLAMHVLLDYFDDAKLHRLIPGGFTLSTSLYQSSGEAPGSSGLVNITARQGGRVAFAPYGTSDVPPAVFYQKSVHESPYDIAVLKVSALISSPATEAPEPEASPGLTDLMSKNGCGGFAGLVTATAGAADTFQRSVDGGLTIFCPAGKAVDSFNPTFKKLNDGGQLALLLYHGVKAHYSEKALKSINGEVNTLATDDAAKSYDLTIRDDGGTVKLSSSSSQNAAKVTKTAMDKAPLAFYLIDAVLVPRELLNSSGEAPSPVPAPAPAPGRAPSPPAPVPAPGRAPSPPALAPAPWRAPSPTRHPAPPPKRAEAPAPAPYADEPAADEDGQKKNGASGAASWSLVAAAAAAMPAVVLLLG